ncbi:hypothetical protein SAMN05216207_11112 [Pseudonocardia ammonioxydans]|uniref:Uncharacterized protein n=2 Tax=Pseudonocardia ammonioxydans TaxID=260086 RepID=A0A1I5IL44_PSUAM|nr:hypothetical protein SAMN05216207_11112 [Pseudonocardia ammonioxydans]
MCHAVRGRDDRGMSESEVWELRVGVYCTAEQARDLVDRIQLLLCPDPDHPPPCPIPWSTAHWSLDAAEAAEAYPELVEQARVEQRNR